MNGEDVNLEQVEDSMAWHYKKYQGEQSASDRIIYSDAEREARRGDRRSAYGVIRIRSRFGITDRRSGISGRAWNRSCESLGLDLPTNDA